MNSSVSLILNSSLFGLNSSPTIRLRSDIAFIMQVSTLICKNMVMSISIACSIIFKEAREFSRSLSEAVNGVLNSSGRIIC